MGKITDALKKAAQERLSRIEKLDSNSEVKYEFIAKKTIDSKIDPRIIAFYDSKSPISEQYRSLRTNIQAINSKTPLKALTITSSTHSEGKTITAINLSISMAHDLNKKRILLVDADLRRASMSKYLGLDAHNGLADLILDGMNVEDTILNIGIENLSIMPAGKIPHNPAEILGSPKMANLISLLKSKYDYIIFDTPPIIPVTDAGVIGAQTDGIIMVIMAGRTQKGVVKHSENLLKQSHSKILGYILTNIQYHIPAYIYRYL
ncbi:MAG: CpsD/CapB family tyrosine-protein kinase [Candidatus Omnitrophota bacterium]